MAKINVITKSKDLTEEINQTGDQYKSLIAKAEAFEKQIKDKKAALAQKQSEKAKAEAESAEKTAAAHVELEPVEVKKEEKPAESAEKTVAAPAEPVEIKKEEKPADPVKTAPEIKAEAPAKEEKPERQENKRYQDRQQDRPQNRGDRPERSSDRVPRSDRFSDSSRPQQPRQPREGFSRDGAQGFDKRDNFKRDDFKKSNNPGISRGSNNQSFSKDKDDDDDNQHRRQPQHQKPDNKTRDRDSISSMISNKPNSDSTRKMESKQKDKAKRDREDSWDDSKQQNSKTNQRYGNNQKNQGSSKSQAQFVAPERKKAIVIDETVTVKELSESVGVSVAEIIKKLMSYGIFATINNEIDFDTAEMVAEELGITVTKSVAKSAEDRFDDLIKEDTDESKMVKRPPIVTVMGHVDHGKTSLLDAIRNSNVTDKEAGGITQHIGAYTVNHKGNKITFLDTPGHEAFTTMRARGANVTDIAVIVVAANDGVMPQTIESIHHAKAAGTPIIIAMNKMDIYGVNPEKVKQQLAENDILVEDWGGDVPCIPVSAKQKQGIEDLLEMILLVAEVQELKANPDTKAKGTIVEARLDKSKGPIATILVQNGTLREGETVVAGMTYGNVRAMFDHNGKRIKKAGPSIPVEITGLSEVPQAGDMIFAIEDTKLTRSIVEERINKYRESTINATKSVSLDDLFNQIQQGDVKTLNLIIKADVQGSVEAVKQSLEKLSNEEVKVSCIHGAVGAINEADVTLAKASNAIIIGFNVRTIGNVDEIAQTSGVDIRSYSIIYNAIDDVEAAMHGMLAPVFKEAIHGRATVRTTFRITGVGTVAGAYVTKGKLLRHDKVRILRDGVIIFDGEMDSLKRFKDDVKEVTEGFECGIAIKNYNDIKEGDEFEAYAMEEVAREA